MNLVELYNQRVTVKDVEEWISRNLIAISSNKLRGFHSIVIEVSRNKETEKLMEFIEKDLNRLVKHGSIQELQVTRKVSSYVSRNTFTEQYILARPFYSKSDEAEKDTFKYFEPDKSTITIKLIVQTVYKEISKTRR